MKKLILKLLFILFLVVINRTFAAVPEEYYANYKIDQQWISAMDLLVKIKSYRSTGNDIPADIFGKLNSLFKALFPSFPKTPNNKVIYEQCLITSEKAAQKVSNDTVQNFADKCLEPINYLISEINSNFTVQAVASVSPKSGSAPLNVTLDAKASTDPSNDTIPSDGFYWYFKDTKGVERVIGKGPVQNFTFSEQGTYVVHLTVRSANALDKGVFDGQTNLTVSVSPEAAVISVYINGKKLTNDYTAKVGSKEAERGILIDGSGTHPTGSRKIKKHIWNIAGGEKFSFTQTKEGDPGGLTISIPSKGSYTITLTVIDNENNEMYKSYNLIVSDPIASIKVNTLEGTTSTTFNFDAGLSYSVDSKIKSYNWTLFDPNGNQIKTSESKTLSEKFIYPGNYSVRLVVIDETGKTNEDVRKIFVDSTPPIAQFLITPVKKWKKPSQFIFDASASSDVDKLNGNDTLKYDWKFEGLNTWKIEKTYNDNQQILVSFNEIGTYKVKLIVTDKYNKINEIEKELKVESALRPEILLSPQATTWGSNVSFLGKANKTISHYKWDFGNGITREIQNNTVVYAYNRIGVFNVTLSVSTPSGEDNEVYTNAFVGERGYPIAIHQVTLDGESLLRATDICPETINDKIIDHPAYLVDRYADVILSAKESLNSQGQKENLRIYFKPKNGEIVEKSEINKDDLKFDELGCTYMELWVEDTLVKKMDKQIIWFKIKNALPKMSNISISFPQYGNDVGIGIDDNKSKNQFDNKTLDPLVVKVLVTNPVDPDGNISYFKWYYYNVENPSRLIEVKTTPVTTPYVIFSLLKIPGEFGFGVKIIDNDGGEVSSEELIGKSSTVFFPADAMNPDIPIVVLKEDRVNAKIGDEITFEVVSKILSDRNDFATNRIIQYDFDGDGQYDMTTKKDQVKHVYTKVNKYSPKAKVTYRGYGGIGYGEPINVEKGLKVNMMINTRDRKVMIRDVSLGEIEKRTYCLDIRRCKKMKKFYIQNRDYFVFDYDIYTGYLSYLIVNDKYGNRAVTKQIINVKKEKVKPDFVLMSLPQSTPIDAKDLNKGYNVEVGSMLNNSILYYIINNNKNNECFLDFDITKDSDADGNPEGDKDLECNVMKLYAYEAKVPSTIARIYYTKDGQKTFQDININFLDADLSIPEDQKVNFEKLTKIINDFQLGTGDQNIARMKTLLVNLRNNLGDKAVMDSVLLEIEDLIDTHKELFTKDQTEDIKSIKDALSDKSVIAASQVKNAYEKAKGEILSLFSKDLNDTLLDKFQKIEEANNDKVKIKEILNQIYTIGKEEQKKGNLDETDVSLLLTSICEVLKYYEIPSQQCGTNEVAPPPPPPPSGSAFGAIFKIIGRVIGILVFGFVGLIFAFAIKARRQQASNPQ